jgi:hypothetical protein
MNKALGSECFDTPLVVDASSNSIQIGIPLTEGWHHVETIELPALEGLFRATSRTLNKVSRKLTEIDALFFCQGPGSTLGLRISVAFVKTISWERKGGIPLYSYNALDMAAQMLETPPDHLQAPFRKGWRFVRSQNSDGAIGRKEIHEKEQAFSLFPDSHHLPDPRGNDDSIDSEKLVTYDLSKSNGLQDLKLVALPTEAPEVYSPTPTSFKKWKPERTPSSKKDSTLSS